MLDIKLIRTDPEAVKTAIARRGESTSLIDEVAELDSRMRAIGTERDDIRAEVKQISKQVGALHKDGKADEATVLQAKSRDLGDREKALSDEADELAATIRSLLLNVSNMPAAEAPDGLTEDDNVEVRVENFDRARYADHQRVPHWEVAEQLGILDVDRAVRMSGSMFVMYRGAGARLLRALISYGLDRNRDAFEEVRPPTLVKTETMVGTGHLPKFADDAYHLERDDLWAIPTAEVPLTSMVAGEILDEADLPLRLMAHTSCYRREAGSAGRDTRGLLRVHEFDKVELYSFCTPDQAQDMHIGCSISPVATSAVPARGPSTSRSSPPARTGGSRSPRFRGAPTIRPVGPTSGTGPTVRRARASSTASMAPDSPFPVSGRRSWRPTGRPTDRFACPTPCCPTSVA